MFVQNASAARLDQAGTPKGTSPTQFSIKQVEGQEEDDPQQHSIHVSKDICARIMTILWSNWEVHLIFLLTGQHVRLMSSLHAVLRYRMGCQLCRISRRRLQPAEWLEC